MRQQLSAIGRVVALSLLIVTYSPAFAAPAAQEIVQGPTEFKGDFLAVCDTGANEVEVKIENSMAVDLYLINGAIWAQPDGGEAIQISGITLQTALIHPGQTGGPEERISNWFAIFHGDVWGEVTATIAIHNPDGSTSPGPVVGTIGMDRIHLDCGEGAPQPAVTLGFHGLATCTGPTEIEARINDLMPAWVRVTGELWAQPDSGQGFPFGGVPEPQQVITGTMWSGAEDNILNYLNPYHGQVSGRSDAYTVDNTTHFGWITLASTHLDCGGHKFYIPYAVRDETTVGPQVCTDLVMIVTPPGGQPVERLFGEKPGPEYGFGAAFHSGEVVTYRTKGDFLVDESTLGWDTWYQPTGKGPSWSFTATSNVGPHPQWGRIYTWGATVSLPGGAKCVINFSQRWDP